MKPLRHFIRPALQRGFTLVEIAVVLIIAGLALGTGLAILGARLEQAKVDNTRVRAEAIRQALVNFASRNYRLPCPAAPGILQGTANYGVERETVAAGVRTCTAGNGLTNNTGGAAPAGVSHGTVPCMTLGIPEDACVDGWDTRFTYFVSNSAIRLTQETASGMQGTMTIHRITPPAAATPVAGLAPTGNQINACSITAGDNACNSVAVAVIISHGANRGGGYTPGGAAAIPTAGVVSAYELENTDADVQFIQNEYVKEGTSSFDDLVVGIAPREVLFTLSQSGVVKALPVALAERFEFAKQALLQHAYSTAPSGNPTVLTLPVEYTPPPGAGWPLTYNYTNRGISFSGCTTPTGVLTLTTSTTVLSLDGVARNDPWGNQIYYRTAQATVGQADPCTLPVVLVSGGPDGVPNTVDDVVAPVSKTEINTFVFKSGGWSKP